MKHQNFHTSSPPHSSKPKEILLHLKTLTKLQYVVDCWLRTSTPEAGPALSDQQNPASSGWLLENNPIDLFCLEYKSRDAVCGCARLLKSAHTTAMNMNQCGCHTDGGPADPGATEAAAASSRSPHLINCPPVAIQNQLLSLGG